MTSRLLIPRPTAGGRRALQGRLLSWYRREARDLPWRRTRDPYCIWVSEVMLQQTQVASARPYYQSFLARFPTLAALGTARVHSVLAAWAGLGYYRRARHLHEAARTVLRDHAGVIPNDPGTFGRLPGVGRYTTGAVLSLAFDRALPVLDGNVARVLSRLFALDASIRDPRGAKALWALAETLVPMRGAGEWNQAVMELGATLCVPRAPRCPACPVRGHCRAFALGRVAELPPSPPRRRPLLQRRAVALVARGGRMLVTRREGRLLGGLWEPPGADLARSASARDALARVLGAAGMRAHLEPAHERLRHVMTHRVLDVEVWRGEPLANRAGRMPMGARWVDPARTRLPLTALARRLATGLLSVQKRRAAVS